MNDSQNTSPQLDNPQPTDPIKLSNQAWDLADNNPIIQHYVIKFMHNLITQTPPSSRLAYAICHNMEHDLLEMDGLSNIFPATRATFAKAKKNRRLKEKELKTLLKDKNKRLTDLKSPSSKENQDISKTEIEKLRDDIKDIEGELRTLGENHEYKPSYPDIDDKKPAPLKRQVKTKDWEILKAFFADRKITPPSNQELSLIKNAELLFEQLGFSQPEKDVLLLFLVLEKNTDFRRLIKFIASKEKENANGIVAKMLNMSRESVSKMLRTSSPLIDKGMLVPLSAMDTFYDDKDDDPYILPCIPDPIIEILSESDLTAESMMRQFVGEPAQTNLDWDQDFGHLGEAGSALINLLNNTQNRGHLGINLLFYGPPGTGKTEAVKAAAKKLRLDLYLVGEKDQNDDSQEPTRQDRLTAVILAQHLLATSPKALILLDEMDDLFPAQTSLSQLFGGDTDPSTDSNRQSRDGFSKVFLNRLLENNKTPTFWITNKPERFDPAFLRRMSYSIEFRVPPAHIRQNIWQRVSATHKFNLSAGDARQLGNDFIVPPSFIQSAVRHAAILNGGLETIQGNLRAASNLLFGDRRAIEARGQLPGHYDLRFLNTTVDASDLDLSSLGERIQASGKKDFSMLLYGPAGTGKSQYFAYLATLLGMDVMVKDAASLNGKYVGETEKNITAAFAEAEARGMFLLIDEADTFLRNRNELHNNHEVAAVNTMLTCMERHTQPFGCTTNLFENIDVAAKRRFLFKVAFDCLTSPQAALAFNHFFGMDPPESLRTCPKLVPSDFVNVLKQSMFLNNTANPEALVRLLTLEANARGNVKKSYSGNAIGFTSSGPQ